jgi:hypothetical protein
MIERKSSMADRLKQAEAIRGATQKEMVESMSKKRLGAGAEGH